jgi:hypothetical protein
MAILDKLMDTIQTGTTDRRMRAHAQNYKYQIVLKRYDDFNMMRDVAIEQLGKNHAWFHDHGRRMTNPGGPFGSHYDSRNRGPNEKHKLYFRTRQDMETVLTLYALTHGITE